MGCGKAGSGRWDPEVNQEFSLSTRHPKVSRKQSDVGPGGQKMSVLDTYIQWGVISSLMVCKALETNAGLSHNLKNSPHSEVPKRRCQQRTNKWLVGRREFEEQNGKLC